MRNLPLLFISLLFSITACKQTIKQEETIVMEEPSEEQVEKEEVINLPPSDEFEEALIELYTLRKYKAQDTTENKPYVDGWEGLAKWKNDFERCLDSSSVDHIQMLDGFKNIREVKQAFVKSEETIDGLFLKVHIEEWRFETTALAKSFEDELLHYDLDRECVSKGGFEWWRIEDRFYFMQSNVFRFAFEFEDIRTILESKLIIDNQ